MLTESLKIIDAKTKIMLSAIELFKQYGFKSVTMDDIAHRSGISKKTLYQHFDNKNAVILSTMAWYKGNMRCECDAIMSSAANAVEAFVKTKVKMDEVYKEINPMALHELQRFYAAGYQQFRESLDTDVAAIRQNLEQGISEGNYRTEINVDILARFHIESSLMILMPNSLSKERDAYKVHLELLEHFLFGIMTPKGEKLYRKYKEQYLK